MKTIVKQFAKTTIAALLFVMVLGAANKLQAQTHVKAAANCILHDAYVKEASKKKNAVSCVDCYCKVCGDKKEKEKEAKNKARELADKQNAEKQKLANEKTRADQKKKAEIERAKAIQNAKDNEAILVAPTPKVSTNNKKETKKVVEPKKETKTISKEIKMVDKAKKIETLLNEISNVYSDYKNFETKRQEFKFSFSGTKITVIYTFNPVNTIIYTYTFDLSDIKRIVYDRDGNLNIYAENVILDDFVRSRGHKIVTMKSGEYIRASYERSFDDRSGIGKIVDLLKQAALEAGATLEK
ncbi:MAG: hypothetical protein E6Q39_00160 [Crocinitomicaceae bacterium]|nr:MAG: hypothetical protein E6Q39_00160 [Crocinitomicaceae bacterium]